MKSALDALEVAMSDPDWTRVVRSTTLFYEVIFKEAGHAIAWDIVQRLNGRISRLRVLTLSAKDRPRPGIGHMKAISDAILSKDPEVARQAVNAHLDDASATASRIFRTIATEIGASSQQVGAAVDLLDGGATVPFVARYRKEATGGLDDTQLRNLADRLSYLREMEARRGTILQSIKDQGKLTDALTLSIAGAETKAALEDIYLPYKPKRRTKAMIARENGLEPLLRQIYDNRNADPQELAAKFVTQEVADVKQALAGARDILAEELSENADLLGRLREFMKKEAIISASASKLQVVDATGKLLETATIYPFQPKNDVRGSEAKIIELVQRHGVDLVAIGNGTGSRETERLVADTIKLLPPGVKAPTKVVVSEAGASVYSASELAAQEFPDLDVSLRGAVSIARRLQDPLAELVKIEPQSIGVGQYQHDVDQRRLAKTLEAVVEDAVNAVGVDLNMASAPLLAHVAGLGPKAFEQCAGFLRIRDGAEPLDASAVHPEAYSVTRKIVAACGRDLRSIAGDSSALNRLQAEDFVDDTFGLPTVRDIFEELEKPGRDPRPSFKTASFADGVEDIKDLKSGMQLEGTVTNVAAFGAFVDIGVHQDGLVHVSQLADRFVKDPHEIVKAGDVVKVRVTEVDIPRKRIGLSMRKDGGGAQDNSRKSEQPRQNTKSRNAYQPKKPAQKSSDTGAFGAALTRSDEAQGHVVPLLCDECGLWRRHSSRHLGQKIDDRAVRAIVAFAGCYQMRQFLMQGL
ncbi:hypothetical protein GQR58_000499 [Nymphon striatum]|nr:hypothetical protein GQR58_000499 [Nymphon striatum]